MSVCRHVLRRCGTTVVALVLLARCSAEPPRPNIVVILADDLGYSDLGCYGSEIETPHIDALAAAGLRFTSFYNAGKCSQTRASLLTGRFHTEVGPGLSGVEPLPGVLSRAGYTTLMVGKWHLDGHPQDRGFDRYFGHLGGECDYFRGDASFRDGREPYGVPEGFYTTDAFTDRALEMVEEADRKRPFFLYLSLNAPHYPLQAPREEFESYRGRYRDGWDVLRERRYERMRALGVVEPGVPLAPRDPLVPRWEGRPEALRDRADVAMAAYAAAVERIDRNVGRLEARLQELGVWDDTLFLFLSDNGASPFERSPPGMHERGLMPYETGSTWGYGKGWAAASNAPFRGYKQDHLEGGIATPLVAHWPRGLQRPGRFDRQPGHVVDLMTTLLELAGVDPTPRNSGPERAPLRGVSLVPAFRDERRDPHPFLFFTFAGASSALRVGDLKLVDPDRRGWQLYDLAADPTESRDLARTDPERLEPLRSRFGEIYTDLHSRAGFP